jgi:uroporphyrinogen-III decarboxylase
MLRDPALLHAFLDHLTEGLIVYAGYQIESGAQVSNPGSNVISNISATSFAGRK